MAIDLLPTLTTWAGISKRPARKTDGRDASATLRGTSPPNPIHPHLAFYSGNELHAIRSGKWKLHLPHPYLTKINDEIRSDGKPAGFGSLTPKSITQSGVEGIASRHGYRIAQQPQALYDLDADPAETIDVAPQHPEIVAKILEIAAQTRLELGDKLTGTTGTEIRAPGRSD
jgi:arylsulfatase A-like enzyme